MSKTKSNVVESYDPYINQNEIVQSKPIPNN